MWFRVDDSSICPFTLAVHLKMYQYDYVLPDASKSCYKDALQVMSSHLCWQSPESGRLCLCSQGMHSINEIKLQDAFEITPENLHNSSLITEYTGNDGVFFNAFSEDTGGTGDGQSVPHVNTSWDHGDAKSYGSSLKLRRDPWINELLVTCMHTKYEMIQNSPCNIIRVWKLTKAWDQSCIIWFKGETLCKYPRNKQSNIITHPSYPRKEENTILSSKRENKTSKTHLVFDSLTDFICSCLFSKGPTPEWYFADGAHSCMYNTTRGS